jgi:hypothetical protein
MLKELERVAEREGGGGRRCEGQQDCSIALTLQVKNLLSFGSSHSLTYADRNAFSGDVGSA